MTQADEFGAGLWPIFRMVLIISGWGDWCTYYVSVGRDVPLKGSIFRVCMGRWYIPLYKLWEGAQKHLSGPLTRTGDPYINKCIELVLMMQSIM